MFKDPVLTVLYAARNLRSKPMFRAMKKFCRGDVLDIGGLDFIVTAKKQGMEFTHWTTLEPSMESIPKVDDPRFTAVEGDGCNMKEFTENTFDTVLCIQVLEHVFEPIRMVEEIGRVLRPGGHAILLLPQTSMLHMAPHHYGNFTQYWVESALKKAGLECVEHKPMGSHWSSIASRSLYYFLQVLRYPGMYIPGPRPLLFWPLFPIKAIFALLLIPIGLVLSIGDSSEEPNNHFVVARKP